MPSLPGGISLPAATSRPGATSLPGGASLPANTLSPDQITTATKRFWHDAQDNATTTAGSWVDRFGNGYDATQGTAGKQPVVTAAAINGRQALRFTAASSQELIFTHATKLTDFMGGTDVAYEWWLVLQPASVTGVKLFAQVDSTTSATTYSLHMTNGAVYFYERRDGVGADTFRSQAGVAPAIGVPQILRVAYTGTACAWTCNGVALTPSGASDVGAMAVDRLIYGAVGNGAGAHSSFFQGDIGESIAFTGSVGATEAPLLTNYLKAKWGISF